MLLAAKLFMEELESKNLKFTFRELSEDSVVVSFPYNGKTTNYFFSGADGKYVSMYTLFEKIPDDKLVNLYAVCNSLNAEYKWFKFYIDKENDLMIQDDAILLPQSAANECFELLTRRVNILDEVKVPIMNVLNM